MCDPLSTSCLLGALVLIPDNHYIFLGLGLTGLIIHIINGHRPSNKLGQVEGTIESVAGKLKHAKEDYLGIHAELMGVTSCLLEATLLVSKIQMQMREPRSAETWKEFAAYLQNSWKLCGTSHRHQHCDRNLLEQASGQIHQLYMVSQAIHFGLFQCSLCNVNCVLNSGELVGRTVPINQINDRSGQAEHQKGITVIWDETSKKNRVRRNLSGSRSGSGSWGEL
ncbi:hypothetical protein K438DRAFT_1773950 [Mycena galopus ATCC 62051]|nr:hypothetical protein K438DRAFT_1773950 [Mycena galopus ATCC 62051]